MSPGHKVLWACCQGNITAVLWCVFILSVSSPRAGTPLTTVLPAGSLRQKCFDICSTQTCRHKQAQPQTDGTHKHCTRVRSHTSSPSESWLHAAEAKLNAALPVHLCFCSLPCPHPLPAPHLFDSQGQGDPPYNGTPFITAGTITGDISLSENFKPFFPIPLSLSYSSFAFSLSFFLFLPSCHPLFFLFFLSSASLHGSQWALLQVRLPLAQAHHCRL